MRGSDAVSGSLFSYVDLEDRVPAKHPLRLIRSIVNEVLLALDADFSAMYAAFGRPSIAPERLLRGSLLQAFYTIRSERQLMEQLDYNLLFRWFVGLGIDDPVWDHSTPACAGAGSTRRTATGCWTPTSRKSSWPRCWRTPRSRRCCRMIISPWTARSFRRGPR